MMKGHVRGQEFEKISQISDRVQNIRFTNLESVPFNVFQKDYIRTNAADPHKNLDQDFSQTQDRTSNNSINHNKTEK